MQQLHLVGFTTELDGLIFSARRGSKSGGFVVALDERFISLVREAVRLQSGVELFEDDEAEPASGSKAAGERVRSRAAARIAAQVSALSPKEIQARLRAGRSIAEVARDAGVDEDWVMRFASPVLAEQGRIVERALTAACRTSRKGESSEPISVAVPWNLVDKGLRLAPDELAAGWSAYHARDSSWVVRFRYVSRGREQTAQWEFDTATGSLVSLNRLASELGYIEAGRRRRRFSIVDVLAAERKAARVAPGSETAKPVAKRAPARTTAPKRAAKKAVAKKAVAKKAVAKKAVAKKAVAKKAAKKQAVKKPKPPTRATAPRQTRPSADRNGRSSVPVATKPRPAGE